MNDIQTYPTKQAAQKEADGFMGWGGVKVVPWTDADGNRVYAIRIEKDKYYRQDGFVR